MSNDILERPRQSRVAIIVACLLVVLLGSVFVLWWQGQGPFKSVKYEMLLKNETQMYFVYDDKDVHLEPVSMQGNMSNFGTMVSARKTNEPTAFTSLLVGRDPETLPDTKTLSDIDGEIRHAVAQAIRSEGMQPRELTTIKEPASFWNATPVKPFRIVVHVKKRFEKDKCIFWVQVELQERATVPPFNKKPIYVSVNKNYYEVDHEFNQVPLNTVQKAIGRKVFGSTRQVISNNLSSTTFNAEHDEYLYK